MIVFRNLDDKSYNTIQPIVDILSGEYISNRYPGFDLDEPDWKMLDDVIRQVNDYYDLLISQYDH